MVRVNASLVLKETIGIPSGGEHEGVEKGATITADALLY
jgi:hypothetical protein